MLTTMNKGVRTQGLRGTVRRMGEPMTNRYFILTGMTVEKFQKILTDRKIGRTDTVYLSPSAKGPIDSFLDAAPGVRVFDLRKYDESTLVKELKALGHTVIEIKK